MDKGTFIWNSVLRASGRDLHRTVHCQVPDEPRESSTVYGARPNSPIPTLSTTANGAYGSPTSSGVPLPTSSGVPLPRISTIWLAGWTSGAS
ncbi:hypothetical protein H671_2g5148 [Cricetulus griseus]|nr:hypothetical protein H671_2g5148 [Cricetulus griseus]